MLIAAEAARNEAMLQEQRKSSALEGDRPGVRAAAILVAAAKATAGAVVGGVFCALVVVLLGGSVGGGAAGGEPIAPGASPVKPAASAAAAPLAFGEQIEFNDEQTQRKLAGRMVLVAQDGGWLFQGRDGVLWAVPPGQQLVRAALPAALPALSPEEYARQMTAELPRGFEVYRTAHYVILHDTSRAYAQWCGALFERLYMAFHNYWTRKGLKLHDPPFPLCAIVFADEKNYLKYSRPVLGDAADSMIGYYHLMTNRMVMFDLTGRAGQRGVSRAATVAAINDSLSQGEALRTVATIIHEATHQIAFNCGMHTRLSDTPLWLCEGVAIYFETPDLSSSKGWRGIGAVNGPRVAQWRDYLRRRPADSLVRLIEDDRRFRDPQQSLDAYAEAWLLTYFLINQRSKAYLDYVTMVAAKPPLIEDGAEKRRAEFEQHFGPINKLDRDLLRYARGL